MHIHIHDPCHSQHGIFVFRSEYTRPLRTLPARRSSVLGETQPSTTEALVTPGAGRQMAARPDTARSPEDIAIPQL